VFFGGHVRKDPALSCLSFADAAKDVGSVRQSSPHEERVYLWEIPAADKMREYKTDLEQYKQTENYRSYQTYLEEFKRGQHKPESTALLDDKASSTLRSARFGKSPASLGQEEVQAARQGELDPDDLPSANRLDSDTPPQHVYHPSNLGRRKYVTC
jgi:hypothetical protein